MGMSASQAGRHDEAISHYQKVISANPANFTAHNNLGTTQFKQGNITPAKDSFRQAIKLKWDYPDAHYNLAVALQEEGKQDEANTEYATACALGISDACKMIGK